jgi:hypothetical protein
VTLDAHTLTLLLRGLGLGLVALGPLHAVLWRVLDWSAQARKLTPLNTRVFFAHVASVVFVVMALGFLLLLHPELLVMRSELGRLLLWGMVLFFGARMLAQPFFFDPILARDWRSRTALRMASVVGWLGCFCVLALALAHQFEPFHFDLASAASVLRLGLGAVWVTFGIVFKVLDVVPRHRRIVGRLLGERWARPLTVLIGLCECGLGIWMWSGLWTPVCVVVQAVTVATMNTLEISRAKDLLLSPRLMVLANLGLVASGIYVACAAG